MTTMALFQIPEGLWLTAALFIAAGAAIILVALHRKGEVSAEIAHGTTSLRLHAKERHRDQTP